MAKVILFGGGDGGGIIIGPHGIEPIPPWEPKVAHALNAIASLANMTSRRSISLRQEAPLELSGFDPAEMAELLASNVVPQLLKSAGFDPEADGGETSVFYAGFDGDFTCGSTGLKPKPRPRDVWLGETMTDSLPR